MTAVALPEAPPAIAPVTEPGKAALARQVVAEVRARHSAASIDELGFRATGVVRNRLGLGPRPARDLVARAISEAGLGSY